MYFKAVVEPLLSSISEGPEKWCRQNRKDKKRSSICEHNRFQKPPVNEICVGQILFM